MATVQVRYIVNDVDAAIAFYCASTVECLRHERVHFRNDIVTGVGGKQVLIDDPSGNPIELFEPIIAEERLSSKVGPAGG